MRQKCSWYGSQHCLWHRFRKGIFWWCDSLHCDLLRNKTVIWSDDMMKWHWATCCLRIRIFRCRSIRSIRLNNRCSSEVLSHLRNRRNPRKKKIKQKSFKKLSNPVVANPPKLLLSARQIFAMGHFHLQDLADLGNLSIIMFLSWTFIWCWFQNSWAGKKHLTIQLKRSRIPLIGWKIGNLFIRKILFHHKRLVPLRVNVAVAGEQKLGQSIHLLHRSEQECSRTFPNSVKIRFINLGEQVLHVLLLQSFSRWDRALHNENCSADWYSVIIWISDFHFFGHLMMWHSSRWRCWPRPLSHPFVLDRSNLGVSVSGGGNRHVVFVLCKLYKSYSCFWS